MSDEFERLSRLLERGWKLHVWRMSSPWNYWMTSPRNRSKEEKHLDSLLGRELVAVCKETWHSPELVPEYRLAFRRGRDCGMPRESIYARAPVRVTTEVDERL